MEHRWGTRHSLDVSVRLDGRPQLLTFARLKNASSSGAYLETRVAPAMLARVWVELDWEAHRRGESGRIAAYVVRTDANGVGLEWCDFAPRPILALIERSRRLVAGDDRAAAAAEILRLSSRSAARPIAAGAPPARRSPVKVSGAISGAIAPPG